VRKNWILAVAVMLVVLAGGAFYTLGQTKIYEAEATILFDPQPPRPLGKDVQAVVDVGQSAFWNNKEYYRTQFWIITSPQLTQRIVRDLGLHKNPSFIANKPASAPLPAREISVEAAAGILASRLVIEAVRDSRLAEVRYRDADKQRAQQVLGRLVDTYIDENLDEVLQSTNMAADWLKGQLVNLKTDLEQSEIALHEYKIHKNVLSVSIDDQSNMLRAEMTRLNDSLTELRTRREHASARRAELMKIDAKDPAELPAQELINNSVLQALRGSYVETMRLRQSLLASGKGEAHPEMKAVTARLDASREAILLEVANIQRAVESDWSGLNREIGGLSGLYEEAKTRALELNLLEIQYKRLQRSKDTNERLFSIVTERSKESDLTRMLRINNIRVVDRPRLPGNPVTPVVPLNLAASGLVGALLGLLVALGREQLDRSVKSREDLEQDLGIAFLGLLPAVDQPGKKPKPGAPPEPPNSKPELIVYAQPNSGPAEAARALRTNILYMSPDKPFGALLVTSAGPAEGKTTVACCIAVAMATTGQRVVLVDCDMRRPRVHKVFGLRNDVGVTTALLEPDSLDSSIHATEVPNMSVLTTGPLPPNPSELLHSESFKRVLAGLRSRFDRVIIDSPPIIPVTDAAVLATQVDGTVLVVRAMETSRESVARAKRALRDVGVGLVGCVLNSVEVDRPEYGYYRYQYYRREGGYASDATPPPEDEAPRDGGALN
jgi:capsular exopolysaccharide synthesis family protein